MTPDFTIEFYKHGIVVKGWIDCRALKSIVKMAKDFKYDLCDGVLSKHYGASFCFTNRKNSDLWREELGLKEGE